MRETPDTWYRYEEGLVSSGCDEFGESLGSTLQLYRRTYRVVRNTPCGVVLDNGRFVNHAWRKRFACPTDEAAKQSFLARKDRQLRILELQVSRNMEARRLLERGQWS